MTSYDDWKLATPPEYDLPDVCPKCGAQFTGSDLECPDEKCGWIPEDDDGDDHDAAYDAWRDEEMENGR